MLIKVHVSTCLRGDNPVQSFVLSSVNFRRKSVAPYISYILNINHTIKHYNHCEVYSVLISYLNLVYLESVNLSLFKSVSKLDFMLQILYSFIRIILFYSVYIEKKNNKCNTSTKKKETVNWTYKYMNYIFVFTYIFLIFVCV